jgi:hypothetical protein
MMYFGTGVRMVALFFYNFFVHFYLSLFSEI